jgi:hypothetical protein
MRLLRRAIQQERQSKLVLAVFLFLGGGLFGFVFFLKKNILATLGLLALMIGLKLLWEVLRQPKVEGERLWQLLNTQRREIVWVYCTNTQLMPFGLYLWERGTMFFMLQDGDEISVGLPARKLKMVSRFLNKLLPHASFGYTAERQQQFEADPKLLLKK